MNNTAVIGMAARLPDADTIEEFWNNSQHGHVSIRQFTPTELIAAGVDSTHTHDHDTIGASALIDRIDQFDAACFGMSPREAAITDPQHRLLLEVCDMALNDSGYSGDETIIGLFGSVGYHLHPLGGYLRSNLDGRVYNADFPENHASALQVAFANHPDFAATRAAFRLNLRGPVSTIQTGCSSGLVGVSQAIHALRSHECELAVVASASLHIPQVFTHRHSKGSVLSATGVCRAFDATSNGTLTGNGAIAVVLKRLSSATTDRDRVRAVITGTGVNNDGNSKDAYSAPSVTGQIDAIQRALSDAHVTPTDIGYIETHGTGTRKGDPIEFEALTHVFGPTNQPWCGISSAKPNIGHLDSGAGLAGLIRAIGAIERGVIPPLADHQSPNPLLSMDGNAFFLPKKATPWRTNGRRIAGVTALGVGGTNAHVIIEEPPPTPVAPATAAKRRIVLPLSAASSDALRAMIRDWIMFLHANPAVNAVDLATTAALGRRSFPHRVAVFGHDSDSLRHSLALMASGITTPDWVSNDNPTTDQDPLSIAAQRFCQGEYIDWRVVIGPELGRRISAPGYPYQREKHWIGPDALPSPTSSPTVLKGESYMTSEDIVLTHIRETTARMLGHAVEDVASDATFIALGADSLSLVNLAQDLDRQFGVRVSMRELFEQADTPAKLAALVESSASTRAVSSSPTPTTPSVPDQSPAAAPPAPVAEPARVETATSRTPEPPPHQTGFHWPGPPPTPHYGPPGQTIAPTGYPTYPAYPPPHPYSMYPTSDPNAVIASMAQTIAELSAKTTELAQAQTRLIEQLTAYLSETRNGGDRR